MNCPRRCSSGTLIVMAVTQSSDRLFFNFWSPFPGIARMLVQSERIVQDRPRPAFRHLMPTPEPRIRRRRVVKLVRYHAVAADSQCLLAIAPDQSTGDQSHWRRSRLRTAQNGAKTSLSHPQGRIRTSKQCGQYHERTPSSAKISQSPERGTFSRTFLQKWHLYFSDSSHCLDSFDLLITFPAASGKPAKDLKCFRFC